MQRQGFDFYVFGRNKNWGCIERAVAGYALSLSCDVFLTFSMSSFIHMLHIFACDMGIKLLRFWAVCEPKALELPHFSVMNQKVIL